MDTSAILSAAEYEALILQGLARIGIDPDEAAAITAGRFGDEHAALAEAAGRGVALGLDDLRAFLQDRFGAAVGPEEITWPKRLVGDLIHWCLDHGRGGPAAPPTLTVESMLILLRSPDPLSRLLGGCALAHAVGTGLALAGETREDVELIVGPQISDLLGRAMAGDLAAADELEELVTADPAAAFRPRTVEEPMHLEPEDIRFLTAAAPEPTSLALAADVQIRAAAGDNKRPTFSIVGYTGAPMSLAGFYSPVIVDLSGLKAASQSIPVLRGHDDNRIVGQTDSIKIGSEVQLTGTITGDGPDAAEVVSQAKNGFKWKASIGASVDRREFLDAGKSATVNGREVSGPLVIARESTLYEVSFVPIGADNSTSASVAAKDPSMPAAATTETTTPDSIQIERGRIRAIRAVCNGEHVEIENRAIDEGWDVPTLKAALFDIVPRRNALEELRASRGMPVGTFTGPAIHAGGGDSTADVVKASILIRSGHEQLAVRAFGERTAEGARRMKINSLLDVCAHALRIDRRDTAGMSRHEIAAEGLSTSSLPNILGDVLGRTLELAYIETTASWRDFAKVVSASDFRTQTAIRPGALDDPKQLPPGGEIQYSAIGEESTFPWRVDTYAENVSVDRRDIVDDSLSFFDTLPTALGVAAGRKLNTLIFGTFLGGVGTFWTSGRGNLETGGGSALSAASLGTAIAALRKMKDSRGNFVQVAPRTILVPAELETTARALIASEILGYTDGSPTGNPFMNIVSVSVEPRLSDPGFTGYSTAAWYLLGSPAWVPFLVGFLGGKQSPSVETFGFGSDPDRLAITFRVVHDFGAALGDPKASIRSAGA